MTDRGAVYGGRWRIVGMLGKGGQGRVYEVEDMGGIAGPSIAGPQQPEKLLLEATKVVQHQDEVAPFEELIEAIRALATSTKLPRAALKQLLPFDEAVNGASAQNRLAKEMGAMTKLMHP